MNLIYYYEFKPSSSSLSITKKLNGKILDAVLHIESSNVKRELILKSPKVHSVPSSTVDDLFNVLTANSIDSIRVFGEQYEPALRDSDVLWRIEFWKNNTIKGPIVRCRAIEGLPKEGWKCPESY
jgi:hypothetical protein